MSYPVLHVPAGDVVPIMFETYAGSTGASITMTGLAVTDIEIYKDGSTTQRASDAGYTLLDTDGTDFDGITGIHGFSIDTGDDTDAGFYTVGSWFTVVVSSVTVDSQVVNFIAAMFRLMAAETTAGVPVARTSEIAAGAVTSIQSGLALASDLATVAGYIDTEVAAIKAKTDNLPASPAATGDIPTAAAVADAVWDEARSGHATAGTFGEGLIDTDERGRNTVVRGTVTTGATTTSIPTSAFSPAGVDLNQFQGRIVVFDNDTTTAALRGQATDITSSSAASNPTLTVTALTTAPASGDTFSVL